MTFLPKFDFSLAWKCFSSSSWCHFPDKKKIQMKSSEIWKQNSLAPNKLLPSSFLMGREGREGFDGERNKHFPWFFTFLFSTKTSASIMNIKCAYYMYQHDHHQCDKLEENGKTWNNRKTLNFPRRDFKHISNISRWFD